jgi:hypothetical protein
LLRCQYRIPDRGCQGAAARRVAEEQAARKGHNTPPEITREIEDQRRELEG